MRIEDRLKRLNLCQTVKADVEGEMESDEKPCPRCAETIKVAAKVCRYCGLDLQTGRMPAANVQPPAPSSSTGKKIGLGCLALVVLLIIIAMFGPKAPSGGGGGDQSAPAAAAPAMKVTARDLAAAYEENEASAQARYGNRPLEVSGTIDSINLDFSDEPFLVLGGTNSFLGPQAKLGDASRPLAAGLKKGQAVVLLCSKVSEVIGTPMLSDCELQR